MWILKWLPNWFFYALFFVGLVGLGITYLMKFIPASLKSIVYMYKIPLQLVSIILIIFSMFMSGAIYDNNQWVARVKEIEQKVKVAEDKSKKQNAKIVTKVVTKVQYIKSRQADNIQYIDREIIKYDTKFAAGGQCEIPKEFIQSLNKAAEAPK